MRYSAIASAIFVAFKKNNQNGPIFAALLEHKARVVRRQWSSICDNKIVSFLFKQIANIQGVSSSIVFLENYFRRPGFIHNGEI